MSKYHSKKTEYDGIMFDSKKEAARYAELKLLERAGEITMLKTQPKYILIPAHYDEAGKLIERACYYKADFSYMERQGTKWNAVVEDVKGVKTDVYKIKRKLMLDKYGIRIREV